MKVYKYRAGSNRDIETLRDNNFYASNFLKLNDPAECKVNLQPAQDIVTKIDTYIIDELLKENNHNEFMASLLRNILPNMDSDKRSKIQRERSTGVSDSDIVKGIIADKDQVLQDNLKNITEFLMKIKELGIYSLSEEVDNLLLWSHYANEHEGFVIEYELEEFKPNTYFNIHYSEYMPTLRFDEVFFDSEADFDDTKTLNLIRKILGVKSQCWEYEKEIRVITEAEGLKGIQPNSVTGVYFGINMNQASIDNITNQLKDRNIVFYQMEMVPDEYRLIPKKLN